MAAAACYAAMRMRPGFRRRKRKVPYETLKNGNCRDGEKHQVMLGLTADVKPAFCTRCWQWSGDVPASEYEGI